jgi:hypothetical protein
MPVSQHDRSAAHKKIPFAKVNANFYRDEKTYTDMVSITAEEEKRNRENY